jgi:transcription factor SPN1
MAACIQDDIESNQNNQPALRKLSYSPELLKHLKNYKVQETFLDIGGCKFLADWLAKLPDGSFPCLNIIEIGLEIVDYLPIEKEHLMESRLGKSLAKIKKMKGGNDEVKRKSQEIINKWQRMLLNLDGGYDESGRHEEQYREYRRHKDEEAAMFNRSNKRRKTGESLEESIPVVKTEDKNDEGEGDDAELKKQANDGFFIPTKNFDYSYRPTSRAVPQDRKVKAESVKGQFLKKMHQMKRSYNGQQKATFAALKPSLNPDKD